MVDLVDDSEVEAGRKGDGLMLVAQDNMRRQLTIVSANDVVLMRLGYTMDELRGRRFEVILGQQSALVIDEELEYDENAPDLADAMARQRELRLRLKSGQEIAVPYRINRLVAENQQSHFQLVLPNDRETAARKNVRAFFQTNLEGHQQLDVATGLPDRATLTAFIERIQSFSAENEIAVCVAVLQMDRWEKSLARYGQADANHLLQHVAATCRATFRAEDVIVGLGNCLGVALIDLSRESARVVLNRLRWNISARMLEFGGKPNFTNTVSIAFGMLNAENSQTILTQCEQAIAAHDTDARNALIEV